MSATMLQMIYDIRAALGWNDKFSLALIVPEVKRLRARHTELVAATEALLPLVGQDGSAEQAQALNTVSAVLRKDKARLP